jgi:hypothetical protein
MYDDTVKKQAELLFCLDNLDIPSISKKLSIPSSTIFRWRKDEHWDRKKNTCNFSYPELEALYIKKIQVILLEVDSGKIDILNPSTADALSKHFSIIQKINPLKKMYGLILTFVQKLDEYLSENDKALRGKMIHHYDALKETLKNYIENRR